MFLTFTIDTKQKKRSLVRFNTKRFNPAFGWRKAIHVKKRSLWQRIKSWRRSLRDGCYKLGGQIAMF
ncbi:MAG: hypothetical protein AAB953_01865 [Patescibacteria group bacterium]